MLYLESGWWYQGFYVDGETIWEDWWVMDESNTVYNPWADNRGDTSVTVLAMQNSKTISPDTSASPVTIIATTTTISALTALSLFACAYMQKRKVDAESG